MTYEEAMRKLAEVTKNREPAKPREPRFGRIPLKHEFYVLVMARASGSKCRTCEATGTVAYADWKVVNKTPVFNAKATRTCHYCAPALKEDPK